MFSDLNNSWWVFKSLEAIKNRINSSTVFKAWCLSIILKHRKFLIFHHIIANRKLTAQAGFVCLFFCHGAADSSTKKRCRKHRIGRSPDSVSCSHSLGLSHRQILFLKTQISYLLGGKRLLYIVFQKSKQNLSDFKCHCVLQVNI